MGGATAGYSLARSGLSVLFLEKGRFLHHQSSNCPDLPAGAYVRGAPPEDLIGTGRSRMQAGWWPDPVLMKDGSSVREIHLPIGCGTGGSTAFFASGLERFSPIDFAPRQNFTGVDNSSLPEKWPIAYNDMAPYYAKAENLFSVSGTHDPLFPDVEISLNPPVNRDEESKRTADWLASLGLHPYYIHVGFRPDPMCDGCPGGHCFKACKSDSAWTCLIPALRDHSATLVDCCEVLRLDCHGRSVTSVICTHNGDEHQVRGRIIVLAAGALSTPAILLRSKSAEYPTGLANSSGQVGRNLMFHGGDFALVRSPDAVAPKGLQKTLALNDFYCANGHKLGTFQTLGVRLEVGRIMQYLRDTADIGTNWWSWILRSRPAWWRKLTSPFVRVSAWLAYYALGFRHATVWVSIVEDLPYPRNRVSLDHCDEYKLIIEYTLSEELKGRIREMRQSLKHVFGGRVQFDPSMANSINLPHASGTCRFGTDPAHSVLDLHNKAHDVENLYVLDASFFPSSGGTNPSLTIAANALRVADWIARALRSSAFGPEYQVPNREDHARPIQGAEQ